MREELETMKKEVEEVKEQSLAQELVSDYKIQNKRLFIIWIITFLALISVTCYTIYLINDIGTETTTKTIDIEEVDNIQDSNIHN